MSHLRAPAARADRREGGRHGNPGGRTVPHLPETPIRPQLLRIAVLPPVAVALSACAAVLFTVRSTGAAPSPTLWAVLSGAVGVTLAGVVIAAVAANRAARTVRDSVGVLRRAAARSQSELRDVVEALRRGDGPPPVRRAPAQAAPKGDDFAQLADELSRTHDVAVASVVKAAQLSSQAGSEQKVEVFVNLARRLQSLVHREITILDDLEHEVEDPELLKRLFHVDHLATRTRRHAENLAVLGGAVSRRQWTNPVSMTEVLRSAIAEVEQYSRVKLVPPIDGTLRGHAVADVIHLLAELVENATAFSAPGTQVLLRVGKVTTGLAVEVEDRGLGMPVTEQNKLNALLADPDQVNVASLLQDGRIGLFVVSQLARRHGIAVRLGTNIYGGVQAVIVVPQELLGAEPGQPEARGIQGHVAPSAPQPSENRGTGDGDVVDAQGRQRVTVAEAPAPHGTRIAVPRQRQGQPQPAGPPEPAGPQEPTPPQHAALQPWSRSLPQQPDGTAPRPTPSPDGTANPSPDGAAAPSMVSTNGTLARPAIAPAATTTTQPAAPPAQPAKGRGLAPLPVRGARKNRPSIAEALPGIRPEDRQVPAEHASTLLTPRSEAVRTTTDRPPQLPKRRAQQHLVPQLREGPVPRRNEEHVCHDPGLVAAFRRGIGLAEAQYARDQAGDRAPDDRPSARHDADEPPG
ncbi:sensor histidine kinase [Streptomyces jeddahensis]|uniref:histidine kinase n=1 Tax=Streptomyces jeddahensis TaxID=1716141 RepID=A0A177HNZ9_9ACTN|nr:ATP-binding protein [Streptomyces jeddahensis]OAH12466.1 histidine kinase-, DNA gyrase B-, and HSP90-like ATPase [Streptomyces jeddahensis]